MTVVPLSLDRFQRDAIDALHREESVLVTAPTGAGKTVVADAAIDRALAAGHRAIYTTPLKALSNQKHQDLSRRLGDDRVGLLTGDRSLRPRSDVVVMTTEIVRALLHGESALLDRVAVLVLDEFHYLRDPDRGSVWEEIVMDAPGGLQMVCLSATMPDAERVHRWLDDIHPPVRLVAETRRPVPLHHIYAVGNLQDEPPLLLPMFNGDDINEVAVRHDGVRNVTRGEGRRRRDVRRPAPPRRATLLATLREQQLLPVIWFMLSRISCERAVDELLEDGVMLNDAFDASRAGALAETALGRLPLQDQAAVDLHRWRAALEHGVATHHGGLLPLQREAVERAFADGLVKVVFATETLAVGVNLPARTTVIDKVTRPESQGGELLSGDELTQLAGRAGRRGLDEVGYAIVPWAPEVSFYRVAGLAGGTPARLESQLQCTATMVASLASRFPTHQAAFEHLQRSLFAHLARDRAAALRTERDARAAELAELRRATPAAPVDGHPAADGEGGTSPSSSTTGGKDIDAALAAAEAGAVIADPARPVPLLVLDRRSGRRGEPALDVLGTDARRSTVGPRSFRQAPVTVGRMALDGWDPRVRGQAREAARELAALERAGRLRIPKAAPPPPAGERATRDDARRVTRLDAQVSELGTRIEAVEDRLRHELDAMIELLCRRGHLEGFSPTASGRLLRRIYHPQALLVAEAVAAGCFDGLEPHELAGVTAAFRAGAGDRTLGRTATADRRITERLKAVAALAVDINRDEAGLDRALTLPPDSLYADAMTAWAAGSALGVALAGIDAMPGDFLRDVRQTIELLDQIRAAAAGAPLGDAAQAAMDALDRDAARIGMLDADAHPALADPATHPAVL